MASVRDRGLAEAPARTVCDTQPPAEVIREFESDCHGVPASERAKMERLAQGILAGRVAGLSLVGHTDLVGTPAYNQKLGLDRAHAVRPALRRIIRGTPIQIMLDSKGEDCTVAPGTSETVRRQNRRVDAFADMRPPPPAPRPLKSERPPPELRQGSIPVQPPFFCLGGQIGCRTLAFIRKRRAEVRAFGPEFEQEEIDIEQHLLMANPDASNLPPLHPGKRQSWILERRQDATRRVKRILAGMIK